jgi:hypothetical protein
MNDIRSWRVKLQDLTDSLELLGVLLIEAFHLLPGIDPIDLQSESRHERWSYRESLTLLSALPSSVMGAGQCMSPAIGF